MCFQFSPCPSLPHVCPLQQTLVFRKIISCTQSLLNLTELPVGLSSLVPLKDFNQLSCFTNSRCEVDKSCKNQRRNHVYGRTEKGDDNHRPRTFNGNRSKSPPDQEEIIALLRRIQLSISKGDSQGIQKRNSPPDDIQPSVESILDVLRESGKQVKDKVSEDATENETVARGVVGTEQEIAEHPKDLNFELTRLPSKFVRKSPIPSFPLSRRVMELTDEASSASSEGDKQGQSERTLEKMKVSQLKELAKSKNIKGYYKLKKHELIQVLRS